MREDKCEGNSSTYHQLRPITRNILSHGVPHVFEHSLPLSPLGPHGVEIGFDPLLVFVGHLDGVAAKGFKARGKFGVLGGRRSGVGHT